MPYKTLSADDLRNIRQVVFLCWGHIGDVFIRIATIEALKRHLPATRITAVVDPAARDVLQNHPDIDAVFVYSRAKKPLWRYLVNTFNNVRALRARHFDLCVNLYSGGSSPTISRLIGARWRLGFNHTRALRKANNLQVDHPSLCRNWTCAFGTVLQPLGIAPEAIRQGTSFYPSDAAKEQAGQYFEKDPKDYFIVNLGARVSEKRWPVTSFVELSATLYRRHGLYPMVIANPGMESLAAEFAEGFANTGHFVRLPLLGLDALAAVMQRCRFAVTGDTSIMHLSYALKLPTLGLFTYTRPELVTPADCVHQDCFMPDKNNINECGLPSGQRDMPVEYVFEQAERLLVKLQ
jgi:ADP-heptose:LPS heptosyltransferase